MKISIDFDGTVVHNDTAYEDLETPLEFVPGAKEALLSLKRAGHVLILDSARANIAIRFDWQHNPMWANDPNFDEEEWRRRQPIAQARFQQMLDFVERNLPGVFTYIDFGHQGKVLADLYLDDEGLRLGGGWRAVDWSVVEQVYGAPEQGTDDSPQEVRRRPDDGGAIPRQVRVPPRREVLVR